MHPLPTKQARPAVELMIEQKCRRVLRMAHDLQREIDAIILLTAIGEPRGSMCDARVHLEESIKYISKVTK